MEKNLQSIVSPLLHWYQNSARDLPWRKNADPYRVWVSEIMLQQTRVEAVVPYYHRFLTALPDIFALANCEDDRLMKLWEGLGYYSRARNLKKCAAVVVERFGGKFPDTHSEILTLPGIGEYTAGAIASIAFNLPCAAVDGNVIRVMSRLEESVPKKKQLIRRLSEVYPSDACGDFTQSLMELGATICTPSNKPKCESCPLAFMCAVRLHNTQSNFPQKEPKRAKKESFMTVFILQSAGKIAVRKRPDSGLLKGLWELVNVAKLVNQQDIVTQLKSWGLNVESIQLRPDATHIFTHVTWHMRVFFVTCKEINAQFTWVNEEELLHTVPLPTAFRKLLQ